MAFKKKVKKKPRLAADPKVQAAKVAVAGARPSQVIVDSTAGDHPPGAPWQDVREFAERGQAAQKAADKITEKFAAKQASHDAVMANKNRRSTVPPLFESEAEKQCGYGPEREAFIRGAVFAQGRVMAATAASRSPLSKTQVCDAVRSAAPGLAFAAVDRIASAVMRLYGRE